MATKAKTTDITVTKGLVDLKTLDKRINRNIDDGTFISAKKITSEDTIDGVSKKEADKTIKSSQQTVMDLIKRRNSIKQAIVVSNATNKVTVGNETFTVAEAIERKNTIMYEKSLLRTMKEQYSDAHNMVEVRNGKLDNEMNAILARMSDSEGPVATDFIANYKKDNGYEIFDPILLIKHIAKLEESIENFEADVDIALTLANSTTTITIPA